VSSKGIRFNQTLLDGPIATGIDLHQGATGGLLAELMLEVMANATGINFGEAMGGKMANVVANGGEVLEAAGGEVLLFKLNVQLPKLEEVGLWGWGVAGEAVALERKVKALVSNISSNGLSFTFSHLAIEGCIGQSEG